MKSFSKTVPMEGDTVKLAFDDLYYMHLDGVDFEPFVAPDGNAIDIFMYMNDTMAEYYYDALIDIGYKGYKEAQNASSTS